MAQACLIVEIIGGHTKIREGFSLCTSMLKYIKANQCVAVGKWDH